MKKSKYNIFVPYQSDENYVIAYNSFNNSIGLLENNVLEILDKNRFQELDESTIESLKQGGFIIDDDFDEIAIIRDQLNQSKYCVNELILTIAPYSGCNFDCVYCYEKDNIKNTYMTSDVIDAIVENIQKQAKFLTHLEVTWYGGEPTMAINIIDELSEKILKICDENEISYRATMVTNGYLLDNDSIIYSLKQDRIKSLQITIDGDKKSHDSRRVMKNNMGTYDKIWSNILKYKNELPHINMRINVDKENMSSVTDILDFIYQNNLEELVHPYLGKLIDFGCYNKEVCFNKKEFANESVKFRSFLNLCDLPRTVQNACAATASNCFLIDSDGSLYKCWHEIGDIEYSFGNIIKDGFHNKGRAITYISKEPMDDPVCKACNLLPICMGGCCSEKKALKQDCCEEKYSLSKKLNLFVDKSKNDAN